LDQAQLRQAAREGLVEAIQEMQAQSSGNNSQGPATVNKNAFALRDANILGNKDAPVTIVEYADFQCPFCGRHHQLVRPTIVSEYVASGKANIVFKHLAFLGPESVYASVAAECAADQGKFWEYHDYLFEHQQGENQGAFLKEKLIGFGKELDLDAALFEKCVMGDETIARVQADTAEAEKFGVGSTPTFFVNGKPLVGLKSPAELSAAIDAALNP
jgi:protein-disulfide isomerase